MPAPGLLCLFRSGEALRSRSVGDRVLAATLEVPPPPARLVADWQRDVDHHLALEPGDVEPLSLPRARSRWPALRHGVRAMADWSASLGLGGLLDDAELALMACRGARYHHDGAQYGHAAFCNLFLGEDRGLDLHFPGIDQRIPLVRGSAVIFDTGQPHAVIDRRRSGFDAADFDRSRDRTLVFLSWELPIENAALAQALGIGFDVDPASAARRDEPQLWRDGASAVVDPATGRWQGG